MVNFVIYLLEFISILLAVHIVFGRRIVWCLEVFGLFFLSIFILYTAYLTQIPLLTYIVHILFFLYAIIRFREKLPDTIIKMALAMAVIAVLETILRAELNTWYETASDPLVVYIVINAGMSILMFIFYCRLCIYGKIAVGGIDKGLLFVTILVNLIVLYVKTDSDSDIFAFLIFSLSVILLATRFVQTLYQNKHKIKRYSENEEFSEYQRDYEDLLQQVRMVQHDYKNEIQAIKFACAAADDAIPDQAQDLFREDSMYISLVTGCGNSLLAGFLYSKIRAFEADGVQTEYTVHIQNTDTVLSLKELIRIVGILLDNAYENNILTGQDKLLFSMIEKGDGITVSVLNPTEYITYEEIERMFEYGYSTKGKNRGIGLHSVQQIINNCNGKIVVGNKRIEQENYFSLELLIPWENQALP